jgi:hypothetical protein
VRKVRNGEWIAALGGVVLIASLFMPWYDGVDAWQAFSVLHVILMVCGLFGPLLLVLQIQQKTAAVPLATAGLGAWAGVLAIALVLVRGLAFPPADDRQWGIVVALVASVVLFTGVWRSLGDERIRLRDGRWSKHTGGALPDTIEVQSAGPGASAESR